MSLEELNKTIFINDGKIKNIKINFDSYENERHQKANVEVVLECRKVDNLEKMSISLIFSENVYYDLFDENLSFYGSGDYSDITLLKDTDDRYYLSLDPYDNSGKPNEEDNDIIKSDKLKINIS